ncbi:MAG: outer membrane protein assembly factor BamC [Burkholderiales bacterium]|nr:outer membrane protein assembly factor BamC [Burkholderiales bacterium]MDE2398512.1 outer membrane protein assembly factor BamC [Burkholderiales bacterium]MDE2454501.1 outer membrane protein assembly factor BamC [Burkholderiales bacterium]
MKRSPAVTPARLTAIALAASLAGCSTIGGWFSSEKPREPYQEKAAESKPLEVPPDLTQLAKENRYGMRGGAISAAASPGLADGAGPAGAAPAQAAPPMVAVNKLGGMHLERDGNQRWLAVPMAPEQLWPQVKAFWEKKGFKIASADATAGVMETDWFEDRSKLPDDFLRRTLGRVFDKAWDTGLRDRFRTRIERTASGSEVFITHQGIEQHYTDAQKTSTEWRPRPADPQLEAQYLSLLMEALAPKPTQADERAAAAAAQAASVPQGPARARPIPGPTAALEVDDSFDRAWRSVGLALDRNGYTVEDRDRAAGVYYIRYVDPKNANKEEPGFFAKLFGAKSGQLGPVRYRIQLSASGDKTRIAVLDAKGQADGGDNARRIADQLTNDLR